MSAAVVSNGKHAGHGRRYGRYQVLNKPNLPALALAGLTHLLLFSANWPPLPGAGSAGSPAAALQVSLLPDPVEPAISPQGQQAAEPSPVLPEAAKQKPLPQVQQLLQPGPGDSAAPDGAAGFYPAEALSQMPEIEGNFDLSLPEGHTLSGQIMLKLWIDASGNLNRISAHSDDLPAAYQQQAMQAFRRMRYRPGQIGAVAVPAVVEIVVEFGDRTAAAASTP